MFIDEGFGTLDAETLQVAMGVLDSLQQRGTQVAIISHVGDLADSIGWGSAGCGSSPRRGTGRPSANPLRRVAERRPALQAPLHGVPQRLG